MIDELGLVVDVWSNDIDGAVDQASLRFLRFLDTHLDALVPWYGVRALGGEPPVWHGYNSPEYVQYIRARGLDQISPYKISYALARILAAAGLVGRRTPAHAPTAARSRRPGLGPGF